jgi:thiamine-phosphate pyrophosphorylase
MRGLYAIADVGTLARRRVDLVTFARAVLLARPTALQLRAKDVPAREMLALLRALSPMCRNAGVPLVANDRVDVAALAGCEYVHLGQEDVQYDVAHRLAPQLKVGVSTHNAEQVASALALRPDYVAYGPVYPTGSKPDASPVVGLAGLRAAHAAARAARIPLVAIGGITPERAADVAPFTDAIAVIAGLLPPGDGPVDFGEVTARAMHLQAAFHPPQTAAEARV